MLYEANALAQITEETKTKLDEIEWKNVRDYAENILGEKLHGVAGVGKNKYLLEVSKIPCHTGMLWGYLKEHGYKISLSISPVTMVISW